MFIAFCTFDGDIDQLLRQLRWCAKLGPQKNHHAVIVADCGTNFEKVRDARRLAAEIFNGAAIITNEEKTDGWVEGPKSLFLAAARHADFRQEPFLLMETDAIPLSPGWADALATDYEACGARYIGHIYSVIEPGLPKVVMSGIGVYAPEVLENADLIRSGNHWDIAMTPGVIPFAHHTNLIHHFWGRKDAVPTFAAKPVGRDNVFTLADIPREAVIWHRNKDGTLIHHLHKKLFPDVRLMQQMRVVFPVCQKDLVLAIKHAQWLRILCSAYGRPWEHKAVVAFDKTLSMSGLTAFAGVLRECFVDVELFAHPVPPMMHWPQAPNWVFQNVAHKMRQETHPWLWLEPDAVVLRKDWLDVLQAEYEACGKNFMGPIVKGMGHVNGGCIYPHDMATRSPIAMSATDRAWDYDMRPDMIHDCHDASHLMRHIWTVMGEDAIEVGGGQEPTNVTAERAKRWIPDGAVMVHRIKDSSLVDLLMRGEYRP